MESWIFRWFLKAGPVKGKLTFVNDVCPIVRNYVRSISDLIYLLYKIYYHHYSCVDHNIKSNNNIAAVRQCRDKYASVEWLRKWSFGRCDDAYSEARCMS